MFLRVTEHLPHLHRYHSETERHSGEPKKIVIVGGNAAGMSAATRARRLDEHSEIVVYEKGSYTSFANCGLPYALDHVIKDDSALSLQTPEGFKKRFNVDVNLHSEVVSIDRKAREVQVQRAGNEELETVKYDKLVLAQGAEAIRPHITGVDLDNVFTLQTIPELLEIKNFIKTRKVQHACIIGGGFIGLEAAENLRKLGLAVTIVEMQPHVLPPVDGDMAELVHDELRKHGVELYLESSVSSISETCVTLTGGFVIPANLTILVTGIRGRTALAMKAGLLTRSGGVTVNSHMQTSDPNIYAVGDMVETDNKITGHAGPMHLAGPANRQGRMAADHMFGRDVSYRGHVGTGIVRVFNLSVGFVGVSVENLRCSGRDPLWITVHTPSHATYYPGSHPTTLRLLFEHDGKILGAQAIGQSGIDKRIDVLATAMQAGLKVFDLEHLELAYAPPYGSAKDVINMAGFVASNVLRGTVQTGHTCDLTVKELEALQVIDVRSPAEYARGRIMNAVNIPIDNLRDRISEIDKNKRVLVYCQVGYRGYLAYRILKQNGFDVLNLDGGFKSLEEGGFNFHTATPPPELLPSSVSPVLPRAPSSDHLKDIRNVL